MKHVPMVLDELREDVRRLYYTFLKEMDYRLYGKMKSVQREDIAREVAGYERAHLEAMSGPALDEFEQELSGLDRRELERLKATYIQHYSELELSTSSSLQRPRRMIGDMIAAEAHEALRRMLQVVWVHGDQTARRGIMDYYDGKAEIRFDLDPTDGALGKTTREQGVRIFHLHPDLAQAENDTQIYEAALILSHELHRTGTGENRKQKTREVVESDIAMAGKMRNSYRKLPGRNHRLMRLLRLIDQRYGKRALHIVVDRIFSSQTEYWKLVRDSGWHLESDGKAQLFDEAGNFITRAETNGVQTALSMYVHGNTQEASMTSVAEMKRDHGMIPDDNGYWNRDTREHNDGKRIPVGSPMNPEMSPYLFYAIEGHEYLRGMDSQADRYRRSAVDSLGQHVEGTDSVVNAGIQLSAYMQRRQALRQTLSGFFHSMSDMYGAQIRQSQDWGEVPEGASTRDLYTHHTGVDIAPRRRTITVPIYAGLQGRVSRSDNNSGAVGHQIQVEHGIEFENTFLSFGFHTGHAHMASREVAAGDMVASDALLGNMGNTGSAIVSSIPIEDGGGTHDHMTVFARKDYGSNFYMDRIFDLKSADDWANDDGSSWGWGPSANRRFYDAERFYGNHLAGRD